MLLEQIEQLTTQNAALTQQLAQLLSQQNGYEYTDEELVQMWRNNYTNFPKGYEVVVKRIMEWKTKPFKELTVADIFDWVNSITSENDYSKGQPISVRTKFNYCRYLSTFWSFHSAEGRLPRNNPFKKCGSDLYKDVEDPDRVPYDKDEIRAIIDSAIKRGNPRDLAIVTIPFKWGIRRAEEAEIRVKDIDLRHNEVLVPKGKAGNSPARFLPMDNEMKIIIERWLNIRNRVYPENPYLFPSRKAKSRHISGSHIGKIFLKICRDAGVTHGKIHEARNTIEYHLSKGMNTNEIDYVLGHSGSIGKLYFEKIKHNPRLREEFRQKFCEHSIKLGINGFT